MGRAIRTYTQSQNNPSKKSINIENKNTSTTYNLTTIKQMPILHSKINSCHYFLLTINIDFDKIQLEIGNNLLNRNKSKRRSL